MTVTYSLECATSNLATFFKLLARWRGSLYKLIYRELAIYLCAYFIVSFVYRFALTEWQKSVFEKISMFCDRQSSSIPLTFVLGFFVSMVATRWWSVWSVTPWPDRFAIQISTFVVGDDLRGRMLRRTLVRYLIAGSVIILRDVSTAVRKRFPTMQHVVDAGLLTQEEVETIERPVKVSRYWIPVQWACTLLYKTRSEGRIKSDYLLAKLVEETILFRNRLGALADFDMISVPLVYTQVVTISVYAYFASCLLGRQYLENDAAKNLPNNEIDLYFPWFTTLQFVFYVGWLKVAETLMNPFGEDDDDFELRTTMTLSWQPEQFLQQHNTTPALPHAILLLIQNWIIERNIKVGFIQVTEQHNYLPELVRDKFWTDSEPEIPHTAASVGIKDHAMVNSVEGVTISEEDAELLSPEMEEALRSRKITITPRLSIFNLLPRNSLAQISYRRNRMRRTETLSSGDSEVPTGHQSISAVEPSAASPTHDRRKISRLAAVAKRLGKRFSLGGNSLQGTLEDRCARKESPSENLFQSTTRKSEPSSPKIVSAPLASVVPRLGPTRSISVPSPLLPGPALISTAANGDRLRQDSDSSRNSRKTSTVSGSHLTQASMDTISEERTLEGREFQ